MNGYDHENGTVEQHSTLENNRIRQSTQHLVKHCSGKNQAKQHNTTRRNPNAAQQQQQH